MQQPKFKDSPVEFDQLMLFPTNIFDLLPPVMTALFMRASSKASIHRKLKKSIIILGNMPIRQN